MATPNFLYLGLALLLVLSTSAQAQNVTFCWGFGSFGQLGNGTANVTAGPSSSDMPVRVLGNHSFTTVCTGEAHSCGLEPSGQAWCWGKSMYGSLGNGADPLKDAFSDIPVEVVGNHTFHSITCGAGHTCALDEESHAWCWGYNFEAQLGSGGTTHSSVPLEVEGELEFTKICGGRIHTCGIEVGGRTLCWGVNFMLGADLGLDYYNISEPTEVAGNHTFATVSCSALHTCALEPPPSSKAWCWGHGAFGQLGNGDDQDQPTPTAVLGGHAYATISAGWSHTCGITVGGTLLCWGEPPGTGQDTSPRVMIYEPTAPPPFIDADRSFVAVSTASDRTCTLDSLGSISCYDLPESSDNSTVDDTRSVLETFPGSFVYLGEAFFMHTCAVATIDPASTAPLQPPAPTPAIPAPAPPPTVLPAPSLAPAPAADTSSSSTVPLGAIAGGVAAGIVVLAVLAFLAWRPGKGWLRRQPVPPSVEDGKAGAATMSGAAVQGGPALEVDTLLPCSVAVLDTLLPSSSASSAEPAALQALASTGSQAATPAAVDAAATRSSSGSLPASDAVLSFIASHLGTQPQPSSQPEAAAPAAINGRSSSNRSSGSAALELHTDARMWEVQWAELTILRRIGRGSFASVYLADWSHTRVAVKVLVSKDDVERGQLELPERVLRELQAEAAVMSRMRHPNIVQFMGLVALPPALITEYCSRGSLYDCLAAARDQPAAAAQLAWHRRLSMAVDAATGLCYLHRRGIIHRDVKSPNLLVDETWRVQVADFNLSKLLEGARPDASLTSTAATNPIWLAPEVLEGCSATAASDVYSFGMVLYELLTWRLPWNFAQMSPFKVGATIRQGGRPEVPLREALPGPDSAGWAGLDAYVQLMRECWGQQPEERPTFDEVVGRLRQLLDSAPASLA